MKSPPHSPASPVSNIPAATGQPLARLLAAAADAVAAVQAGHSLNEVLERTPAALRPGTQALAFHTMRWLGAAKAAQEILVTRRAPAPLAPLLTVSLALLWPRAPELYAPHTVVDQAVACARKRHAAGAGFVNAVLRRFLRERESLQARLENSSLEARWQHPAWWVQAVQRDWPDTWAARLAAAQQHPPMFLRVNARQDTAEGYVRALAEQGHGATALGPHTVVLERPLPVQALPGFAEGRVSVQDLSAQLAGPLLVGTGTDRLPPGAHVLDACAAPGGKTAHLLELADLDVLALDADATRLTRVTDTLARLHLQARTLAADARHTAQWWDGRPFDAILLDAPCSASGIVRRHPDARWLRRASDIPALARTQAELLDALWPLLAPGGRLVYATCSLFKAEGEQQLEAFLQRVPNAKCMPAPGHVGAVADNESAGPPPANPAGGDGFYYARVDKQPGATVST